MKKVTRRSFLKILGVGAAATQVPSVLASPDKPESKTIVRRGLPYEALKALGIEPSSWQYRGWDVHLKKISYANDAYGNLPYQSYKATNGKQEITIDVDRELLNLIEDKQGHVNSQLDVFIDEASKAWHGKGIETVVSWDEEF